MRSGSFLIEAWERLAANPPFLAEGDGMFFTSADVQDFHRRIQEGEIMLKDNVFDQLGTELDRESWQWLCEHQPRISDAIEAAVMRGATPDQVRAFVLRRCGAHREELSRRCESAARHLGRGE